MSESIAVVWCRTNTPGSEIGVEIGIDGQDVVVLVGEEIGLRLSKRKAFVFAACIKEAAQGNGPLEDMLEMLPKVAAKLGLPIPEVQGPADLHLSEDQDLPPNGKH